MTIWNQQNYKLFLLMRFSLKKTLVNSVCNPKALNSGKRSKNFKHIEPRYLATRDGESNSENMSKKEGKYCHHSAVIVFLYQYYRNCIIPKSIKISKPNMILLSIPFWLCCSQSSSFACITMIPTAKFETKIFETNH